MRLFRQALPQLEQPEKLLISRPDRLGDVVISSTCLAPLRQALPNTWIALAVREAYTPLFRGSPFLDAVIGIPESRSGGANPLCSYAFDVSVQLNPDPFWDAEIATAGIPLRLGYSKGKGEWLTAWSPYHLKKAGKKHEARYNFDLLTSLGLGQPSHLNPVIQVSDAALKQAMKRCGERPLILIHLGSYGSKPGLPPVWFAQLARILITEWDCTLGIVGAQANDPGLTCFLALLQDCRPRILNLVGKTSIEALAALCRLGRLMLSRDSGPAHLAAALGCPTLTFFMDSRPHMGPIRWYPLGEHSEIYHKPVFAWPFEKPQHLARRITHQYDFDEVLALVQEMLLRESIRGGQYLKK